MRTPLAVPSLICLLCLLTSCLTSCTKVFFQPDRYYYVAPERLGLQQEEITFTSKDGTKLSGWFFHARTKNPKTPAKGTIIQFHGNAENMSSHYLSLVWLTEQGYNFFTFDYRGYGKSEGSSDLDGVHEDGVAALNKAWELHQASSPKGAARANYRFIVYGQSIGSVVGMSTFGEFAHQADTSLIVMDSSFHSYTELARQKLSSHWLTWLFSPLGWLLVSDKYESDEVLKKNHTRLLVIHDKSDPVVPYDDGREVFDLNLGQKDFWELNQGYHVGIFAPQNKDQKERFVKFLDEI